MCGRRQSSCWANLDCQAHRSAKPGQHVDERIRTEEIDPPAEEIADARLGHTEHLRGSSLFEATRSNEFLHLDHEIRSNQQMLSLLAAKPEVTEYIPSGRCDFELRASNEGLPFLFSQHHTLPPKGTSKTILQCAH